VAGFQLDEHDAIAHMVESALSRPEWRGDFEDSWPGSVVCGMCCTFPGELRLGDSAVMHGTSWAAAELHKELERFEAAARAAGLAETSVRTYVDGSRFFVRWFQGDFEFKGPQRR
jgi:hypothetical protein